MTLDPTCAEAGEKTSTCANGCGHSVTASIDATGEHEYSNNWTNSTDGKSHVKACVECGVELESELHYGGTPTSTSGAVCTICQCVYSDNKPADKTSKLVIATVGKENGWNEESKHLLINIDENITLNLTGGNNTGKYYDDVEIRIYQTENPTININSNEGFIIVSVKITFTYKNGGVLTHNGSNILSENVIKVNSSFITFGVGSNTGATNAQVKITEVEVVYAVELSCTHSDVKENVKDTSGTTHSKICTSCGTKINTATCSAINEANCTVNAVCSCGRVMEKAYGHNYGELIEKVDSTCTTKGMKEHYYCDVCKTYFDSNKNLVDAEALDIEASHKNTTVTQGKPATCTESGLKDGIFCNDCNTVVQEQEVIPALEHDIVIDKAVDATCTEPGLTEGSHCSRCDDMTVEQEVIEALGHSMSATWEYDDAYYHVKDCGICGYVEKQLHDDGTDKTSGVRTCETCGKEYGKEAEVQEGTKNATYSLDTTTKSVGNSNYANEWSYGKWTISGGANNNKGWDYIKLGGNSTNLGKFNDIHLRTSEKINVSISKINIIFVSGSLSKSGMTAKYELKVYSDSSFSNEIDSVVGITISKSGGTHELLPSNGISWPANSYYKIKFTVSNTTSTNGVVCLSKVELYNVGTMHVHNYSIVKSDATSHLKVCSCGDVTKKVAHSGGTATETTLAICTVCKTSYGELLTHIHEYKN